jgi:uncharacterized membrane protein (UPF0127 family)
MKFPIDVLFIDQNMEVIRKIEGLKPRRIIMPQKKCKMVIEGKEGIFNNVKVGKKLIVIK